jgi:uncharacterized SAM-binding protein YcdF (DUF218 family)
MAMRLPFRRSQMLVRLLQLASFGPSGRIARLAAPILVLGGPIMTTQLPLGSWLIPPLAERFNRPVLAADERIDGIIALGGSFDRLVEAVRVAHRLPNAKLIITGFGNDHAYEYARLNGIAPERLVLETKARSTFQNAVFTRQLLVPAQDKRWLLVTSAAHMPRAFGCFRKAGFNVLPWPVLTPEKEVPPSLDVAGHEWLGLIVYRLLGRSDSVFPGPEAHPMGSTVRVSDMQRLN